VATRLAEFTPQRTLRRVNLIASRIVHGASHCSGGFGAVPPLKGLDVWRMCSLLAGVCTKLLTLPLPVDILRPSERSRHVTIRGAGDARIVMGGPTGKQIASLTSRRLCTRRLTRATREPVEKSHDLRFLS
jgi:hypothetical protein